MSANTICISFRSRGGPRSTRRRHGAHSRRCAATQTHSRTNTNTHSHAHSHASRVNETECAIGASIGHDSSQWLQRGPKMLPSTSCPPNPKRTSPHNGWWWCWWWWLLRPLLVCRVYLHPVRFTEYTFILPFFMCLCVCYGICIWRMVATEKPAHDRVRQTEWSKYTYIHMMVCLTIYGHT